MIKKIKVSKLKRTLTSTDLGQYGSVENDNLVDKLYFVFDELVEGQASMLTTLLDDNDEYVAFPLTAEEDGYSCDITNSMLVEPEFEFQLMITNGDVVWHSLISKMKIKPCLEAGEGELPTAVEVWLETADAKLLLVNQAITRANNVDIDSSKSGNVTTVVITRPDGTTKTTQIIDAQPGPKGDKGDKGDPGAIKMVIVNELPSEGAEDTIYLLPIQDPTELDNNYAEYIFVDGNWELLGKIGVHVDLTDYVKNTDYASSGYGGVIKVMGNYGTDITSNGRLMGVTKSYTDYNSLSDILFISKGTLENVITGKGLTTKSYVDGLVGDINETLDLLNGEVI